MSQADRILPHITCLGCGCACDDIELVVRGNRIAEARHACATGVAWFGTGQVPTRSLVSGREVTQDAALAAVAARLASASAPLVYLAPDLTCEAQRHAVALADALGAVLDSVTSATTLESVLAAQERGRVTATLGEIRNRADLIVCWGVNPERRYPRFLSRYATTPVGVHTPLGRRSRLVVSVDVDGARGPRDADARLQVAHASDVAALTQLSAALAAPVSEPPDAVKTPPRDGASITIEDLAGLMRAARYVAIVADAEPDPELPPVDRYRSHALIALGQALNARTRAAVCLLRGGGNRSGADAVLTWQTGFPLAVDFGRGVPRYRPRDGAAGVLLTRREVDVALVIGAVDGLPSSIAGQLSSVETIVVGPRASESALASAAAIDTGVAGVHEEGMALRMDDVPLPLRVAIDGFPSTTSFVQRLCERIVTVRRDAGASRGSIA